MKYNLPAETQIDPNGFLQMTVEDFRKYFELSDDARMAQGLETQHGDIVAKIPQGNTGQNRDITGGLPRLRHCLKLVSQREQPFWQPSVVMSDWVRKPSVIRSWKCIQCRGVLCGCKEKLVPWQLNT